jgi:peptide/nickel transport system substrate-binding protein
LSTGLKEGLTWSDGEPLTSADARFTYEEIIDPDNQIVSREGFEDIDSFETPDEQTVRFIFGEPYAAWRTLIGGQFAFVIPEHVYADQDFNTALNDEVVGSGPFVFGEYRRGESITIERNENYWGEAPALDLVTFRFIPDSNSLIAALEAGEVGFIRPQPDIGLTERLRGIDGAQVDTAAGTQWEAVHFNLEEVDNLQLRQAVAYGINRQQIVDEVLEGQVSPLQSVLVPEQETFYTPAWEQYAYDADRASQLVEEAIAAGAEPKLTFSTTSGVALRETLQQIVQDQLSDIGITVEIDNTSPEDLFGTRLPEGNFVMGDWAWFADPDPQLTTLFSGDQLPPDGQNYYRYDDEEVNRLLDESDAAIDEGERARLLQEVQNQIAQDLPIIPLFQRLETYAYLENLSGPEVNPTVAGPFWNIGRWSLSR